MTPTIVVASKNRGKLAEIQTAAQTGGLNYCFRAITDLLPDWTAPIEDGDSFEANAAIKAGAAFAALGLPTLADDSGLIVDALSTVCADGSLHAVPGVYSSSFAGVEGDDARNNKKLLQELAKIPVEEYVQSSRSARFVATLVLVGLDTLLPGAPNYVLATGSCEGTIAVEPRGEAGFGYDPLFLPTETQGRSMAELDLHEKNTISHRGHALESLMNQLLQY
ncbi:MAG: non-canonical purine NTP pyrophosphatase, RdgB/HAM1 family [Coriobacteriia bacterium]|nr:non-canonical purine NTP pyrophosphatase, RdgB/HAM1 family [Coriobacteriia bacterium]